MRWFLKALHSAAVEDYDDESVCRGKSIFGEAVPTSLPFSALVLISLTGLLAV